MGIDTSIYAPLLQPKSVEDYQAERQQRESNALLQMLRQQQVQQGQRQMQDDTDLRAVLRNISPTATPQERASGLRASGLPAGYAQAATVEKNAADIASEEAKARELRIKGDAGEYELKRKKLEHTISALASAPDPASARQKLIEGVQGGMWSMQDAQKELASLPQDPQQYQQWRMNHLTSVLGAKDQLELGQKQQDFKLKANNELVGVDGQVNEAVLRAKSQVAKAGASNISMNSGQKGYENESKLRNDFKAEPIYKDFQDMKAAHAQITSSLKLASPIADTAAATKIMKLLDPGSVVRESELGIAMAAAGKLDRLQNFVQMWVKGETLTPTQRKDFQALADDLFEAAGQQYNTKRGEYANFGKAYGLSDKVLGDAHTPGTPSKSGGSGALPPEVAAALKKHGAK